MFVALSLGRSRRGFPHNSRDTRSRSRFTLPSGMSLRRCSARRMALHRRLPSPAQALPRSGALRETRQALEKVKLAATTDRLPPVLLLAPAPTALGSNGGLLPCQPGRLLPGPSGGWAATGAGTYSRHRCFVFTWKPFGLFLLMHVGIHGKGDEANFGVLAGLVSGIPEIYTDEPFCCARRRLLAQHTHTQEVFWPCHPGRAGASCLRTSRP